MLEKGEFDGHRTEEVYVRITIRFLSDRLTFEFAGIVSARRELVFQARDLRHGARFGLVGRRQVLRE